MTELVQVLTAQAELAEAIAANVGQQQSAIVHFDIPELERLVADQEELLPPFHQLEAERSRIGRALVGESGTERSPALQEILRSLSPADAEKVRRCGDRLRSTVEAIRRTGEQNRVLLEHSGKLLRESLRLLTGDFRKRLIDQRM